MKRLFFLTYNTMKISQFFQSKVNRIGLIIAFIIIFMLQYQLWFGETGRFAYQQLKQNISQQQELNQSLILRNHTLFVEMQELKQGLVIVEEYARLDLGLIKAGETFIQINTAKEYTLPKEFMNQEEVDIAPTVDEIAPDADEPVPPQP